MAEAVAQLAEGRAEGLAEGKAEFILRVLGNRGMEVTEEQRRTIRACSDTAQLERWLDLAMSVGRADDLFA